MSVYILFVVTVVGCMRYSGEFKFTGPDTVTYDESQSRYGYDCSKKPCFAKTTTSYSGVLLATTHLVAYFPQPLDEASRKSAIYELNAEMDGPIFIISVEDYESQSHISSNRKYKALWISEDSRHYYDFVISDLVRGQGSQQFVKSKPLWQYHLALRSQGGYSDADTRKYAYFLASIWINIFANYGKGNNLW